MKIEYLSLEDVCERIVDCPHESPEWRDQGIHVIRNFNLVDGQIDLSDSYYVDEETYRKRIQRAVPQAGDIIFSREAPIGNCAIIPDGFKCCLGQRLVLMRVNKSICSSEYLLAALMSDYVKCQIDQVSRSGSIVSNFNIGDLKKLVIPVVENMESVAKTSALLNAKLSLNKQLCSQLESMAKTLYDYWFVQFDFPDANGKPYRTSGGEMVWNEQLKREIPKGWNVYYVSDCCDIIDCLHSEKPKKEFENEDAFLLQLENLVDNGLVDITNKYYVSVEMYKLWTSRVEVRSGDLLVTNAGRAGAVYRMPEGVCAGMGRNMTAIRPNKVPPTLLYYFFTSRDMETQIKANTDTGAFFKSLNVRGIKQLRIVLPQTNESAIMHELEKRLSSIRHLVEQLSKESTELARLRDWLLPMFMNGQATVAPAEPAPKLQVLQPEKPARDPRFDRWLQTQGVAARGTVDEQTLHDIFDAMDDDDKQ